jgi:hypothetical protein
MTNKAKSTKTILPTELNRKWFDNCLFAILFLMPFDRLPSLTVSGLRLKPYMLPAAVLIVTVLLAELKSRNSRKVPHMFWGVVGLLVWASVRLLFCDNPRAALVAYFPLLFMGLLALSISYGWRKLDWSRAMYWLFAGAIVSALFGLWQYFGNILGVSNAYTLMRPEYDYAKFGFPRLLSLGFEPLFYSAYLLLPLSVAIMLAGHHDRPIMRKNSVFYSVLILLGVTNFLTVSRGGIAAMILSLVVISLLLGLRWKGQLRVWAMARGAVVFLSIIFVLGAGVVGLIAKQGNDTDYTYGKSGVGQLLKHLTSLNIVPNKDDIAKDDATSQRSRARTVARSELGRNSQRLLFGFGPGQYKSRVDLGLANVSKDPNNLMLQLILDYGLIGLGFLLWILVGVYKFLIHEVLGSPVIMRQGVAIALLGYFTGWLFQTTTYSNYATITMWVAIGLVFGIANERINTKKA